uniref:Uncharacterized protein n=1 Tax=Arundo donax TaxID=35708 RepID=A0A0A9E7T2_ARUDO
MVRSWLASHPSIAGRADTPPPSPRPVPPPHAATRLPSRSRAPPPPSYTCHRPPPRTSSPVAACHRSTGAPACRSQSRTFSGRWRARGRACSSARPRRLMRPARRGGVAVGASARALLVAVLLLVAVIGRRGAEAIRVVPHWSAPGSKARNRSRNQGGGGGGGGRVEVLPRKAMPLVGTRPVPVRLPPAGSADEESKRRIPSCPDPLHNR